MVHRAIIAVIWLIAIVREVAQIFLKGIADRAVINAYLPFLYLLAVYLISSLPSKYDVVVIINSILDPKEKEN